MATITDLKDRLWLAAQLAALRRGYRFSNDCEPHVRRFIEQGVNELNARGLLTDEVMIRLAEAGITTLVEKMADEALAQGFQELRETTFMSARGLLCPLWPFC